MVWSPITVVTKLTRPNHFIFMIPKTCGGAGGESMWNQVTRGLAMLFSLSGHTLLHRATQTSHLRSIPPQLRCSWEQGLNHPLHTASSASTESKAALLGSAGQVQTASLQQPGDVAAELHHLHAHLKDLERIARSTIRIYYCIHRIRGREQVKKKTIYQDLYFNIWLKLSIYASLQSYLSFISTRSSRTVLSFGLIGRRFCKHSTQALCYTARDNPSSAHRSHFIMGLNPSLWYTGLCIACRE